MEEDVGGNAQMLVVFWDSLDFKDALYSVTNGTALLRSLSAKAGKSFAHRSARLEKKRTFKT